ncbi:hypothetical protein AC1031_010214 [Aphanomyces cochlioides]|nr:hypothetical protein AC1031_010214 [Aphanomyces cochlioides]
MSTWRIPDDETTRNAVATAIQRIGSSVPMAQVQHITQYLTEQQWFMTARDLRVALSNSAQWTALEIPARLKLALEEVLQEWDPPPTTDDASVGYTEATTGSDVGSWVCVRCQYENRYEDSFCIVCYEHYSVSVPSESSFVAPSAPEFDQVVCVLPVAEVVSVELPVCPVDPNQVNTLPPPSPLAISPATPTTSRSNDDELSEHFKALAFHKTERPSTSSTAFI